MTVKEIKFPVLEEFRRELPHKPGDKWIFRGEEYTNDINQALKTTLEKSFKQFGVDDAQEKRKAEIDVVREFQRKLHLYMDNLPTRAAITEWLAIMQHH